MQIVSVLVASLAVLLARAADAQLPCDFGHMNR